MRRTIHAGEWRRRGSAVDRRQNRLTVALTADARHEGVETRQGILFEVEREYSGVFLDTSGLRYRFGDRTLER